MKELIERAGAWLKHIVTPTEPGFMEDWAFGVDLIADMKAALESTEAEKAALRARVAELEGMVPKKSCCVWWQSGEMWESSCGVAYEFTNDGPEENGHKFCHSCGLEILINVDEEDFPAALAKEGKPE